MNPIPPKTLVLDFADYKSACVLSRRLRESGHQVTQQNGAYFREANSEWEKEYDTVVLPPGVLSKLTLSPQGLKINSQWKLETDSTAYRIKRFVEEHGGTIVGICAGAMALASGTIISTNDGTTYLMKDGLELFDTPAMHYKAASKTWQLVGIHGQSSEDLLPVQVPYFDGACLLTTDEKSVTARYSACNQQFSTSEYLPLTIKKYVHRRNNGEFNEPPAMAVKTFASGGKALFCGCHPELQQSSDFKGLAIDFPDSETLDAHTKKIRKLWSQFIHSPS